MFKNNIEKALNLENSIEALRHFVLELSDKGLKKEEIYTIFYEYSLELADKGRDADSELLEDVLDMITGWYVGRNLELD